MPFGESIKSPFEFVVEIVFVSTVILSTFTTVKLPPVGVFPPITAPSIVPPSKSAVLISGALRTGEVNVLFVRVCVASVPTRVVVEGGSVTVTFPEYAECAGDCSLTLCAFEDSQ